MALAVNPDETYVKVVRETETYIMAEALVETVLGEESHIIEKFKGKELERLEYESLFKYANVDKKAWYVTCADFVTLTDGTGIVHIAPAFA